MDLGTSALKLALVGDDDRVIATASRALTVQRPVPGHSEQHPAAWWQAACEGLDELKARVPHDLAETAAVAISGQMHGATLLDAAGGTLRPCILWNDGRSQTECAELEAAWPALRQVSGNLAMPGFTAPKLAWVRKHEPGLFARIAKVLLPKAWLGWKLTGQYVEEMSDASGTLWLDVAQRRWSAEALAATGLTEAQMPRLVEGSAAAAELNAEACARWGFRRAPLLAGGAGDNAAGAVGVGAVRPGDAFVSLGTSGVLWATTAGFAPNPARAVHAFCHALPATWHQMGVLLNAASALAWWAQVCGRPEAELVAEAEAWSGPHTQGPFFAPYLAGERTPHNDAALRGGFAQLAADTPRAAMTQAVLEGVAYALRDCQAALADAGTVLTQASALGGGARSAHWVQVLADVLGLPLHQVAESEHGGALGAARLARMACGAGLEVARPARRLRTFEPRADAQRRHADRHARWQAMAGHARDFTR